MADAGPETDFNGDGYEDLAVGVPNESINGKANAGSVNVIYGSAASGISATATPDQRFFKDSAGMEGVSSVDDFLGTSVAAGDFNGDGYSDLAAGAPGSSGPPIGSGSVSVIYGSASGLSPTAAVLPDQLWTYASPSFGDEGTYCLDSPHSHLGGVLAAGDFNGDGYDDLAIGNPSDTCRPTPPPTGGNTNGSLNIIYGSASGLSTTAAHADQYLNGGWFESYADRLAVGDFNNDGYADLAVGEPFEVFSQGMAGGPGTVGHVEIYYGSPSGLWADSSSILIGAQLWSQDSPDIEGEDEAGDHFGVGIAADDFNGDGYSDLAIGTEEDVGTPSGSRDNTDEGSVHVIYGSPIGLSAVFVADQLLDQDSADVEDTKEAGDRFGAALAAGDYNGDGRADLTVGAPGEDVGATANAGSSNVIYGSPGGLSPTAVLADIVLDQNSAGVEGTSEATDDYSSSPFTVGRGGFGAELAAGDYNNDGKDDLVIGVPGEDVGTVVDAGSSNVIYGSSSGISATAVLPDRVLDQNSADVEDSCEAGDRFGASLA
jgi:hypothetical protein